MMSASALSAQIRAKKKKMEMEHSDAVKLSGIPMDATDIMANKTREYGEMNSEHTSPERDEEPTIEAEMAQEKEPQGHSYPEDPHQINQPADGPVEMRKAKIRMMLSKMGK